MLWKLTKLVLLIHFFVSYLVLGQNPKIIALSLKNCFKEQNRQIAANLAGINRVFGYIIDKQNEDIILIGLDSGQEISANIENLITACRVRLIHDEFPLVSIDPDKETAKTKKQKVRFEGHIENTEFGEIFLNTDILLKKYALKLMGENPLLPSYRTYYENAKTQQLKEAGYKVGNVNWYIDDSVDKIKNHYGSKKVKTFGYSSRFWFYPKPPMVFINRKDVFLIRDLDIGLQFEEISGTDLFDMKVKEAFVNEWSKKYYELADSYVELKKMKLLFDFCAIANSLSDSINVIKEFSLYQNLTDNTYVKRTKTETSYPLHEVTGIFELNSGLKNIVNISGGIQFGREVKYLNYGEYGVLKKIVLSTKPDTEALYWELPLNYWKFPNSNGIAFKQIKNVSSEQDYGCAVNVQSCLINTNDKNRLDQKNRFNGFEPIKGISMKMFVDSSSITPDSSLNTLRNKLLFKK